MKKTILLFVFAIFTVAFSFAQTKKIAIESHSGKISELKVDGDGNFGEYEPNPILLAEMHRYADSVRRADSIRNLALPHKQHYQDPEKIPFDHYVDSARKADSMKQVKHYTPLQKSTKKPKAIRGAAAILKPKETQIGFK